MKNLPLISVIIPTYNRKALVLRALDSVLRQSYPNFEVLICDDGSTDKTQEWISRVQSDRVRYYKTQHHGVASCRNFGARHAKGQWLAFLDSDDVWHRHKLSEQGRFHHLHPEFLISQTDDFWIRDGKRVNKMKKHSLRSGSLFVESLERCLVCCSSVMVHKNLFWAYNGFNEDFQTCEDYDLWIRILSAHPIGFVAKILVTKFGGHADQLSKKYPVMDRYRLKALYHLLENFSLDLEQRNAVESQIRTKEKIVNRVKK